MKGQLKQLGKHSAIFGVGDALKGLIGFLLIPVYTRYLTPTDYGYLALLTVTLSIASSITSQGMSHAFLRTHAYLEQENCSLNALVSTTYFYLLLSVLVIGGMLFYFSDGYSGILFGKDDRHPEYVRVIAVILVAHIAVMIPFNLLRVRLESVKYISLTLLQFVTQCTLNIVFIVAFGMGLMGVLLGNAISSLLMMLICLGIVRQHLILKISPSLLKELITFGLPVVAGGLAIWVLQMSDRFLIEKLGTTHEVGLYSLGSSFANVLVLLLILPFRKVWGTFLFKVATKENAGETFREIANYFFLFVFMVGAGIIIWIQPVIKIVAGRDFWDAWLVVAPLVGANICTGIYLMFTIGVQIEKQTKYIAYVTFTGAVVNVALNVLFIPQFGMLGAAFSSMIAYLLINILSFRISQKLYFIPFDMLKLTKLTLCLVVTAVASAYFEFSSLGQDVLYRLLLTALFFSSLLMVRYFDDSEITYCRNIFCKINAKKGVAGKCKYALELMKG